MELIPKNKKVYKWTFGGEDKEKPRLVFHIKIRTNRDRIKTQLLNAQRLLDTDEDYANDVYGDNIEKIENHIDNETLTKREDIVSFCLDRLPEHAGAMLQNAIQIGDKWLNEGLIKNSELPLESSPGAENIIVKNVKKSA